MRKYLTIDLGRTWLRWAVTTEQLDVEENGKKEIENFTDPEAVFRPLRELADAYRNHVNGIALTLPGVIDSEKGNAYSGGVFKWVKDYPYAKEVEKQTGLKTLIINDAKAGTLAEIGYGALKNVNHGVMLMILGTGIGGALITHGQIQEGAHHAAGEFSYMLGDYQNREGGEDMFALSMSIEGLTDIVKNVTGNDKMNVMKIMYGLNMKDEKICEGVSEYCDRLAAYIYNIQCVVDAEKFVIAGNITDEPVFMNEIQEAVNRKFQNARYHNIFVPQIIPNVFHEDSRKYGAVYLFKKYEDEGIL